MADRHDPIDDSTPIKRRKINHEPNSKQWDFNEESGEEFTENDFQTAATLPLATQQRQQLLQSSSQKLPSGSPTQPTATMSHVTQPTQPLHAEKSSEVQVERSSPAAPPPAKQAPQPMQRAPFAKPGAMGGGLLAGAIAPPGTSFRRPMNATAPKANNDSDDDDDPPVQHSDNEESQPAQMRSNLKSTNFQKAGRGISSSPNRVQQSRYDPASSKVLNTPTAFTNMIHKFNYKHVQQPANDMASAYGGVSRAPRPPNLGPRPAALAPNGPMSPSQYPPGYPHPHMQARQYMPGRTQTPPHAQMIPGPHQQYPFQGNHYPPRGPLPPHTQGSRYGNPYGHGQPLPPGGHVLRMPTTIEEIADHVLRERVQRISFVIPQASVQHIMHVLQKCKGDENNAMTLLVEDFERLKAEQQRMQSQSPDVLSRNSPMQRRGVAQSTSQGYSSQGSTPVRPMAKQNIQAKRTIAEKYGRKKKKVVDSDDEDEEVDIDDDSDEDVRPRGRQAPHARPIVVDSSPPISPQVQRRTRRVTNKAIVLEDSDEDGDSGVVRDASDESDAEIANDKPVIVSEGVMEMREQRVLKLLNESSVEDIAEITAKPQENIKFVLDQRPFNELDEIRNVVQESLTKAGKKSKKVKELGNQLVEELLQVMSGYDAVDELVLQCETMAAPLLEALKAWGVGENMNGELQLMNLDEAHDSGIGTPASSCSPDEPAGSKRKSKWIRQPKNMSKELVMKDYQLVGINWLHMLFEKQYSCILADDMGLGKTCQIIAFLAQLQLENVDGVHLIIVPGSTLENWLREFERFAPDMSVRPYYGSQAERAQLQYDIEVDWENIDVIVTTYDMAVGANDNKFLRNIGPFAVCVYDEAHMLRNPNSNRYSQLTRIGADFKVLLTGTPLQNNLQELIAILAFIMPEMFQEKRDELDFLFKHKATTKDTSSAALLSNERVARARTMMTPFILRRKKAQVLDLPKKESRVEYCEMTDAQSNYYADLQEEAQRFFNEKDPSQARKNAKQSSNIIMSLRKAAIHPLMSRRIFDDKKLDKIVAALAKSEEFGDNPPEKIRQYLNGEAAQCIKGGDFGLHRFVADRPNLAKRFALKKDQWMDAGKVQKFKELVTKYVENGDRVLVFSQFTTLMDILEAVLETLSIKFMRLDGSTNMADRQEMIDRFTEDKEIPVFMLSTRAGGAGINLAAANKVIIFDSGFNPQDDIQAENRAHRVGQTREVEVVRLVTRGTIEEQIHALGNSKLALDERVAGEAATAADTAKVESEGEKLVQDMFVKRLKGEDEGEALEEKDDLKDDKAAPADLKDAFKQGLEGEGLKVESKQKQF